MERQSASASLDSGCRDDPYHPPSCRPSIVTVTVPDSLFLSLPLSFSFSLSLFFSSSALRSTPTSSSTAATLLRREHDGPSRRGIFDRAFSFSLFCSFCSCGKDPLRLSTLRPPTVRDAIAMPSIERDVLVSPKQVNNKSDLPVFDFLQLTGNRRCSKDKNKASFTKMIYALFSGTVGIL